MNIATGLAAQDSGQRDTGQHGIGQRVARKEDRRLLRGEGRYTDDINLPGQAYAVMVRSAHAHGTIRGIDLDAARELPGVLGVYRAADLEAAGLGSIRNKMPVPNRDGSVMNAPPRPGLPKDRVRFVGEAIAFVVAETRQQAKDAAEAVFVDIEPLPALLDPAAATAPGAPQLHAEAPGNVVIDFQFGDGAAVAAAFAAAAHVVRQRLGNNRIVVSAMEPRAALAEYDAATDHWTMHTPSQGVFGMRQSIAADILGTPVDRVRVMTGDVGGSFGMKGQVFPEQVCLLHAARALGRPVKWTDDRSQSFLSDHHGRSAEMEAELALDAEGRFLAFRMTGTADIGAFMVAPQPATLNAVKNIVGAYRTPLIEIATKSVLTNKTPVGAYRGAGRPEANYYLSRLIDLAAADMGIDPIELRRRNLIPASAMPYRTPTGLTYDSGDFAAVLDKALALADWDGFAGRKRQSAAEGKLRGRGVSLYLEATGPQSQEMGGIRFEPDGGVTMITGTLDYGQGHASSFAQVLVDRLGVPFDRIRLLQGDSDALIAGGGTGGSKSMMASGTALALACDDVIRRGKTIAGLVLEAAEADIEFASGRFAIAGTDRFIGVMELADLVRSGLALPEETPQSMDASLAVETPTPSFPNGCHLAEVEIDPETGITSVVRYTMVNDFGTVINPMLVEGQAHGGVLQGLGQALCEGVVHDAEGQPLTGSFMDYALPRATDAPPMHWAEHPVPATTNILGVKGCGEAGCAGALPSIMGAVVDALSGHGVRHLDMPATPERVWRALHQRG